MSAETPPVDASRIVQTAFGFWNAKVLLTAVDFGVFTHLGPGTLTGDELRQRCGLHPRGVWDFLDALVAMGFLGREGDGPTARYRNTSETATYLDQKSPRYVGGILTMLNARLFRFWHDLPEALRTGRPQNEMKHSQRSMFEEVYADPQRLETFLNGMTGLSRLNFESFVERFDLSRFGTLCDVGGATGLLACLAARRYPHLRCVSFDLPVVAPVARRYVESQGLADRVEVASGDFFRDPLPAADVITMGMILHDWNEEKKRALIAAAYSALREGGALVAIENVIDDARRRNVFGLLMSLNMLIEFGDAFDFTDADFRGWCRAAGFRRFELIPLGGPCSAAVAYK
jgi:SAM-dependent methyltransferase